MAPTLYERLGGAAAIDAAVPLFYKKVLADDRIKHFFRWTNMAHQTVMQKKFLTMAFGGPNTYDGKNMRDAHRHLVVKHGLSDVHFDAVIEHLGATLAELGVAQELIAEAAAIAETTRDDVLCREEPKATAFCNYAVLAGAATAVVALAVFAKRR